MEEFVNACLEQANKRNHNSIAFPALGTGYHKFPADVAAGSIVAAINRFSGQQKQQNIKDIRVVLYGGSNDLSTLEKVEFVLITIINMGTYKGIVVSIKVAMPSESDRTDKLKKLFYFFFKNEYFIHVPV